MRRARSLALAAVLLGSASIQAQSTDVCASPGAPQIAITVPPALTTDEFRALLDTSALFPVGTRVLVLPYGDSPTLLNRGEVEDSVFALLDRQLNAVAIQGDRHQLVLMVTAEGRVASVAPGVGDVSIDAELTRAWLRARFQAPTFAEGCPLPARVQVPLVFMSDSALLRLRERHPMRIGRARARDLTIDEMMNREGVVEVLRAAPGAASTWRLKIGFAPNGLPDSVTIRGVALADSLLSDPDLAERIRPQLRRIAPAYAPEYAVVIVTTGRRAGVRFATETRPTIRNLREVQRALDEEMSRITFPPGGYTVHVSMEVNTEGRPESIRVNAPLDPAFDEAAVRVARAIRFIPAAIEGEKVRVRVTLPITFM
jgi:TonB family protein